MNCFVCNSKDLKEDDHRCEECVELANRRLTDKQYLQWLLGMQQLILGGLELEYWDNEEIGCKETYCSWGMCNHSTISYPDSEMWLYKEKTDIMRGDKVSIVGRQKHHWCPFDSRKDKDISEEVFLGAEHGCFFSCKVFANKIEGTMDAAQLFDDCIRTINVKMQGDVVKENMGQLAEDVWGILQERMRNFLSPICTYFELSELMVNAEHKPTMELVEKISQSYALSIKVLPTIKELLEEPLDIESLGQKSKKDEKYVH